MKSLRVILIGLVAACGSSSEYDLDDEAAAAVADGKADGLSFTRLERATPTQATNSFKAFRGNDLTACFAAYKQQYNSNATEVTKAIGDKFYSLAETHD